MQLPIQDQSNPPNSTSHPTPQVIVVNPNPVVNPLPNQGNQAPEGGAAPLEPPNLDQVREDVTSRLRRSSRRRTMREPMNLDRLGGPRNRAHYSLGAACSRTGSFVTHQEAVAYQNAPITRRDLDNHYVQNLEWKDCVAALAAESKDQNGDVSRFFAEMDALQNPIDGTMDDLHPLAFASKAAAKDNPRFEEAMNGPNSQGFWEASLKEVETLAAMDTWVQVKREKWMNVIQSTWSFKIKRFPDGLVRKLKSRMCGCEETNKLKALTSLIRLLPWFSGQLYVFYSFCHFSSA